MRFLTLLLIAAVPGACSPAAQPQPPLPSRDTSTFLLLAGHNRERLAVGVPPLAWSDGLAAAASAHARQLAALGTLRHSSRQQRPGQDENLWMGTRGGFTVQQMVASWSAEQSRFRPGIFPAVSRSGNWADVGHYTQMIWPTTTHLGCAIASGPRFDVLVCRYAPAGNVDGRRVP